MLVKQAGEEIILQPGWIQELVVVVEWIEVELETLQVQGKVQGKLDKEQGEQSQVIYVQAPEAYWQPTQILAVVIQKRHPGTKCNPCQGVL